MNQHEPLGRIERETLYFKLQFMAAVVGGIADRDDAISTNECCGMMSILYEIADQVFPEGKQDKK